MYCLSSFCCVCLKESDQLQDINQVDIDGLPLINKIIFVAFGHDAIDYKVVKYICSECTDMLQLAYKFKRSCLVNHELLRIYSGQLKFFTGKVSEYQELVVSVEQLPQIEIEEEKIDEPKLPVKVTKPLPPKKFKHGKYGRNNQEPKIFKCVSCEAIFNRHILLQNHINTKHKALFNLIVNPDQSTTYSCVKCSTKLCSLYSLTKHLQLHKNKEDQSQGETNQANETNQVNETNQAKETNQANESNEANVCRFCQIRIENRDSYRHHLFIRHADRPNCRCLICNMTFKTDFNFRRHMFLNHTPKQCTRCDQFFFNNDELAKHISLQHRTHKCGKCAKSFSQLKNLKAHMKSHEKMEAAAAAASKVYKPLMPSKRKKCTNCLSVFTSKWGLKKHRCFQLKNMFQCQTCFLVYSKKNSFLNHVKNCVPSKEIVANTPELEMANTPELEVANTPELEVTHTPESGEIVDVDLTENQSLIIKQEGLNDLNLEIGEVYSMSEFPDSTTSPETIQKKARKSMKSFPKIRFKQNEDIIRAVKLRRKNSNSSELNKKRNETNFEANKTSTSADLQEELIKVSNEIEEEEPSEAIKTLRLRRKTLWIGNPSINPEIAAEPAKNPEETIVKPIRLLRKSLWIEQDPLNVINLDPDPVPQSVPRQPSMWDPPETPDPLIVENSDSSRILKSLLIKVSAQNSALDTIVLSAQSTNCIPETSDVNENIQDSSSVDDPPSGDPAAKIVQNSMPPPDPSIISVRKVSDINNDVPSELFN